jgi:hypothetical protein
MIEADNTGSVFSPRVSVDTSGNAIAIWEHFDGTRNSIWTNRYVVGPGWGTALPIESDTGDAILPQVALDSSGNALAIWHQSDGTRFNIWGNRYVAGVGWSTPALLETDNVGNAARTQLAVDATGSALAIWEQSDGTRVNIVSSRFE